jgi:hypothetical protein
MKYKTGDILIGKKYFEERLVLGVCGLAVFVSTEDADSASSVIYTEKEVDNDFTLKLPEWKPDTNETYYFVRDSGKVEFCGWTYHIADYHRLATKNCFRTREEAEARLSEIKKEAGLI